MANLFSLCSSVFGSVETTCDSISNKLTEWSEQDEKTRGMRDYIAYKEALADCAKQDEKLSKALARTKCNEQELLQKIATFNSVK